MSREQNFVSAVVCLDGAGEEVLRFLSALAAQLEAHFSQYEIIAVRGEEARISPEELRRWAGGLDKPVTLVSLSPGQPHEQRMNAGLDLAVGDYVYEFDSAVLCYEPDLIWRAYRLSQEGSDIVNVCPRRERPFSRLFYRLFNLHSGAAHPLRTDVFRLVSRRAVNRVHAISENMPFRKAAYAACGLKLSELEFDGRVPARRRGRLDLAVDSLVLYTDFGYRASVGFALLMMLAAITQLVYTVVIYLLGNPVSGWTTTMFVLTFGLTGMFAVQAIILKYLTLLLRLVFRKQNYLVEGVEKL